MTGNSAGTAGGAISVNAAATLTIAASKLCDNVPDNIEGPWLDAGANLVAATCPLPTPPCPADLDGDGSVEVADLLLVVHGWGPCPEACVGDVDGDGQVCIDDLMALLAAWGPCPEDADASRPHGRDAAPGRAAEEQEAGRGRGNARKAERHGAVGRCDF
jgi:hypothetical protein